MSQIFFKYTSYLILILTAVSFISCSGAKANKKFNQQQRESKYFRILADAYDDPIFVKLQDDLGIEPKMERYTIVIDVRDANEQMRYVLLGDDVNPKRFSWSQLSIEVQRGLLNWTGSNKERLD